MGRSTRVPAPLHVRSVALPPRALAQGPWSVRTQSCLPDSPAKLTDTLSGLHSVLVNNQAVFFPYSYLNITFHSSVFRRDWLSSPWEV